MVELTGPYVCHCFAARRSARWITRHYDMALSALDITISQYSILSLLHHHGSLRVAELANLMVMERTSLVRSLQPLIEARLVDSETVPGQRAKFMAVTSAGEIKLQEAVPFWEKAQHEFEESFGQDASASVRDYNIAISALEG